ncbi:MAG: BamA/TamA family outer membrane protein [Thermotogaceae bacterium]|nr:BamA/TamA family outer membrane protein [Thermotogaceae bacterium]
MRKFAAIILILVTLVAFSVTISRVKFVGLENVSEAQLEILLKGYLGEDIPLNAVVNEIEMMKRLIMDTGYFSDIRSRFDLDAEGNLIVEFVVRENPVIEKVEYKINGPKLVEESEISSSIAVKEGTILNTNDLKDTVENIRKLYGESGYFLVDVQANLNPSTVLTINIDEYGVWDIVFKGEVEEELDFNELKKGLNLQTLKDYYDTPWWIRWIKDKKKSYPKVEDVQRMLSFLSQKYYFVNINIKPQPVYKKDIEDKAVNLVFYTSLRKIVEDGSLVKEVEITGNSLVNTQDLMKIASSLKGKKVTNIEVLRTAQKILDLYNQKGYLMTWLNTEFNEGTLKFKVLEKRVRHVVYEFISPTEDCRIDYISDTKEVKDYGCTFTHTKEFLIDDLVTTKPGDPLYQLKLADTYGAINRSNYFEQVDILPLGTKDSTQVDILIKMKEKEKKFQFMGALSWGPPGENKAFWEGFGGQLSLSTTNPWGRGQNISLSTFLGFDKKSLSLSYGLPRPFMLPMKFDTALSYEYLTDATTTQSTSTINYSIALSTLPINNNIFSVYYRVESMLPDWEFTNVAGISHVWDSRDSALNPMKGVMIHESLEKGGFVPAEAKSYYKVTGDFEAYIPIYGNFYFALRGFGGYVYNEKGEELIVPAPFDTVRGQVISGEYAYRLSAEIRYSIYKYPVPVNAVAFYDLGNGTNDINELPNFVSSTGAGLNIVVPMLGPIEVGIAYKTPENNWDIYFVFGVKNFGILPGVR